MDESTERVFESRSNDDGTIVFRRSNGSTIWKGNAGPSGSKILSTLVRYTYSTVVSPPPNQGQVRTPTDQALDTTIIWVHRLDYENRDVKFLLVNLAHAGTQLYVQDINNSDSHAVFNVLEDPTDQGDYLTFNVECDSASGAPLAGSGILLGLFV